MMLSVLKHTKTPVKFWFLKNYLSPTFKVRIATEKLDYQHHAKYTSLVLDCSVYT